MGKAGAIGEFLHWMQDVYNNQKKMPISFLIEPIMAFDVY
jgi:hypothetical protein